MTNRSEYAPVECVNIPKMLFQEKQYEKLSVDAKLLYSLLLDRKTLANMNGWIDQNGTAYVVYPKSELCDFGILRSLEDCVAKDS